MLLPPRYRKIVRDLWNYKSRTLLVVLSIAVGVFAVGTVAYMYFIISDDLVASYETAHPAHVLIQTAEGFDAEFIAALRRMPEVAEIEGWRSLMVKFKHDREGDWHTMQIFAIPESDPIRVNRIFEEKQFNPDPSAWPEPAVWPPPERQIIIERTSLLVAEMGLGIRAQQGDSILVEIPNGKPRELPMAGLCYDLSRVPSPFIGYTYGYVTLDTLEWLGAPRDFNELHIRVTGDAGDWEHVKQMAQVIRRRVEQSGFTVLRVDVPQPGRVPLYLQFQAVTLILGALGVFVLLLSVFLVINTVSALLAQQVRQIGIMKSVGARSGQIMQLYLSMVLVFGLLAVVFAVPLAIVAAYQAIDFMSYIINFQLSEFQPSPWVLGLQVLVGILVPVLAALYPVWQGALVTVREAIASYGLSGAGFGSSWIDRRIEAIRGLPRPFLLSLRNTFRRKTRLLLTLASIMLGGAVFVSALSVRASMDATLEELLRYARFDLQVQLNQPYRIERIEYEALQIPGVVAVEGWSGASAYRVRADESESERITLIAPPADSQMLQPALVAGRWLLPEDENALVINTHLRDEEPDIEIGSEIVLDIKGRDTTWRVVGFLQTVEVAPMAYANYPYFARLTREADLANRVQIVTQPRDNTAQSAIARALTARFEETGMRVTSWQTTHSQRAQTAVYFDMIALVLVMMAILMVIVGGLGLMGTMTLNVLERTREIGVMRAIGASDETVLQIVMNEGIIIGLLSGVAGGLLALPVGKLLSDAVGVQFFGAPLAYTFSLPSVGIWLVLVALMAAVATYIPAQRAGKISVREALAYE